MRWSALILIVACAGTERAEPLARPPRRPAPVAASPAEPHAVVPNAPPVVLTYRFGGGFRGCPNGTFQVFRSGLVERRADSCTPPRTLSVGQLTAEQLAAIAQLFVTVPVENGPVAADDRFVHYTYTTANGDSLQGVHGDSIEHDVIRERLDALFATVAFTPQ